VVAALIVIGVVAIVIFQLVKKKSTEKKRAGAGYALI